MSQTVDLVVAGDYQSALTAAADAVRRGRSVLVVLRSADSRAVQRFRRQIHRAATTEQRQLTVMTNAEIVCVEGIDGVEAVVIRHLRSRRLRAVNASSCQFTSRHKRKKIPI